MCCVLQEFITYVVMAALFLIAGIVAAAQAPHSSGAVGATAVSNTVFTRGDRRGDGSRDRSPRRSPRVNTP